MVSSKINNFLSNDFFLFNILYLIRPTSHLYLTFEYCVKTKANFPPLGKSILIA